MISEVIGYELAKEQALEIVRRLIPCRCLDAYKKRGLKDPACPWHNYGVEVEQAIKEMKLR